MFYCVNLLLWHIFTWKHLKKIYPTCHHLFLLGHESSFDSVVDGWHEVCTIEKFKTILPTAPIIFFIERYYKSDSNRQVATKCSKMQTKCFWSLITTFARKINRICQRWKKYRLWLVFWRGIGSNDHWQIRWI